MGAGLFVAPAKFHGFDGVDDWISINNSQNVGSPYDFEYNTPFTLVTKFNTPAFVASFALLMAKFKLASPLRGYFLQVNLTSGVYYLSGGIYYNDTQRITYSNALVVSPNTDLIAMVAYDGLNTTNSFRVALYNATTGALVTRVTVGGITGAAINATIKTTEQLSFGRYNGSSTSQIYRGNIGHQSAWNVKLSDSEMDSLALKIATDTVSTHTLFATNCVGYWREHLLTKVINMVNTTYNGTLNNS